MEGHPQTQVHGDLGKDQSAVQTLNQAIVRSPHERQDLLAFVTS